MRAVQKDFEYIGESGCYFLSIVEAANRFSKVEVDIYKTYKTAIASGWMTDKCYINNPDKLMAALTNRHWTVTKEDKLYRAAAGEIVILRFERTVRRGMKDEIIGHFVLAGPDGAVAYDPYGSSETVRSGKLISKRVFRLVP